MSQLALYEQSLAYFLAPIQPLLDDPDVTEILINGAAAIYYEKYGQLALAHSMKFPDQSWLAALSQNLAEYMGRKLDATHHSLSGRLPDGSRVHVMDPTVARNGICISIRRFGQRRFSLEELVDLDALPQDAAQFLSIAVKLRANIAISGGTGSGKTTLLNALSSAIPNDERILVIEETSEIVLQQPHVVSLETRPSDSQSRGEVTIRDLFVDSLRMRPDRIIVGEVRRGEALDMVQSMLSGHAGALTTVHANSPLDALTRFETLCLMTEEGLPHYVARLQVASAIHLIVQIERLRGARRVTSITECLGLNERDRYRVRPVFRTTYADAASGEGGRLEWTQRCPRLVRHMKHGLSEADAADAAWLLEPMRNTRARLSTIEKKLCRDQSDILKDCDLQLERLI